MHHESWSSKCVSVSQLKNGRYGLVAIQTFKTQRAVLTAQNQLFWISREKAWPQPYGKSLRLPNRVAWTVVLTPPHGSLSRRPLPASPLEKPHNVSCSHYSGSLGSHLRTVYTVGHYLAKVRQMAPVDSYITSCRFLNLAKTLGYFKRLTRQYMLMLLTLISCVHKSIIGMRNRADRAFTEGFRRPHSNH